MVRALGFEEPREYEVSREFYDFLLKNINYAESCVEITKQRMESHVSAGDLQDLQVAHISLNTLLGLLCSLKHPKIDLFTHQKEKCGTALFMGYSRYSNDALFGPLVKDIQLDLDYQDVLDVYDEKGFLCIIK